MALPLYTQTGLLPEGIHATDMQGLHARCVAPYTTSNRETLWQGLGRYQQELLKLGIHATQWVNGSFVDATRTDPGDIDVVNFCTEKVLHHVPENDMQRVVDLLAGDLATVPVFGCQTNW